MTCYLCGKRGHFKVHCRSRASNTVMKKQETHAMQSQRNNNVTKSRVQEVVDEDKEDTQDFNVFNVSKGGSIVDVWIGNQLTSCVADTGASVNVIPQSLLPKGETCEPSNVKLTSYGGNNLQVCGSCSLVLRYGARKVVNERPLLCTETGNALGLLN